ncbi:MAG: hypothetical protein AB1521_06235 [Bacteroidota bacterium]
MKKGCFLTSIIILTIVVAIGLYLYKKYGHEFADYGKEKILEVSINEINEEIDKLEKSIYQDSLKIMLKQQAAKYKDVNFEDTMNKYGDFIDQMKFFIHDGKIDSIEYIALKNMTIKNERPEKNRN